MARDQKHYKFCSTSGLDREKCPDLTAKTPLRGGQEIRVDDDILTQIKRNDNSIDKIVDLTLKKLNTNKSSGPKINFFFGTSEMYPESVEGLKNSIDKFRGKKIILKGFTDSIGLLNKNSFLADERAKEVKRFLIGYGIRDEDIKTEGYPICCYLKSNDNDENRKENRRVEIFLSN